MKHLATFRIIDAIARSGSIRAAAEQVSQTPSAVQRRLQSYEEELGFAIFERSSRGVRPSAAGELVIHHVRDTLAETERLGSRVADLAGMRRGHVAIGCSQALVPHFLPRQIALYQAEFPKVTFDVRVIGHDDAAELLESFAVDLVLVFGERGAPSYDVRLAVPQPLSAIVAANHPLARHRVLRLRQCYEYPVALASGSFGARRLLDSALAGKSFARQPVLQSDSFEFLEAYVAATDAVSFQIRIGAPGESGESVGTTSRPLDTGDVPGGLLLLGQKRDRTLSVAASRFVEQIARALDDSGGAASG